MAETSGARPARPTLNLAGQDKAALADGLLHLMISEDLHGLYACEALFNNWQNGDHAYFDRRVFDFGKAFKVKLGADANTTLFAGRIMALEAEFPEGEAARLRVLAEDRFQDLRMTRRTRTFSDLSDADLMRQIAGEHGLTTDINLNGPTHKVLAQVNQSNLAFLRERARAIDAELWMDGSQLIAKQHDARPQTTLKLSYENQLRSFTVLADLSHQRTSVTASGWDVAGKKALKYEATDQVIRSELGKGSTLRVFLPCSTLLAPVATLVTPPKQEGWRGTGTILVIDDDSAVRHIVSHMLTHVGLSALVAESGLEGLSLFDKNPQKIDVVLLDMTMPGMDGLETARQLKSKRQGLPIVLMSGYSLHEVTLQSKGLGIAGVVQKPFNMKNLLATVRHALGQ